MEKDLKNDIGFFGALSIVVGTVIGAGVFFKIAAMVAVTQSASLTLLAWAVGGILTICAGLSVAELAAAIPETGGAVKYLERSYGKLVGFLFGWVQVLIYNPGNMAALGIIFATQVLNLLGLPQGLLLPIAIGSILTIMSINLLGSRFTSRFQQVTSILKLIPIFLIIIFGLSTHSQVDVQLFPIQAGQNIGFFAGLGGALVASLFAFDGWMNVGNIAGEMKNPQKHLSKVITIGLLVISFIYIAISLGFLKVLPLEQIAGNANTASDAAQKLFGVNGGKLVTIGILVSVYSTLNGYTMTAIRVPYALALGNSLPFSKHLSKLNKNAIPFVSTALVGSLACIFMAAGSFDILTNLVIFVMWLFSFLLILAVFILRKKEPNLHRPYKVVLYPVLPIVGMLGALFIMWTTITQQPVLAMIGIAITLAGIPVFYYQTKMKRSSNSVAAIVKVKTK
ncbi:amino acid permease [uncultured Lactococcus sp.]|uniref:APC family permease n=1 Tax=uncultured Lactococcus sp. TaxID=167973 RepID=UPI0027DD6B95|nr:amino acid permease [uncultured Lactococcus sp.]